jgi:hypothetical protein
MALRNQGRQGLEHRRNTELLVESKGHVLISARQELKNPQNIADIGKITTASFDSMGKKASFVVALAILRRSCFHGLYCSMERVARI